MTGNGTYAEGESVTVEATPANGYRFVRWTENGTQVSTSATYSFNISSNRALTAVFERISNSDPDSSGSSSGGNHVGSSDSDPTYSITVPSRVTGGTVKLSPSNASAGQRVTITIKPNAGYELDALTVTDSKGNTLTLTDQGNGKYTFTMPSSRVSIDVSFKATVPAASVTTINFTDVPANAYYADAVAWAVENGITAGTGDGTTFSPSESCTRAQAMTFLYRDKNSPVASGTSSFTDVSASAYYAHAIQWAVANGVTYGVTDTSFGSDQNCTRAQIMSFMYRARTN